MSRLLSPCWRFAAPSNKLLCRSYQTNIRSRFLFCLQSSNHFRIPAWPLSHRCATGARYFPVDLVESTSTGSSDVGHAQGDVAAVSLEDCKIYLRNQQKNSLSSGDPATEPSHNFYFNEDEKLLSNKDETFDNRESLAVHEDEALFLDDFNRNLPFIKPTKQPASYWASMHPLEKDLFNPTAHLMARSTEDSVNYIKKHSITITGDHHLPPLIQRFEEYHFPKHFAMVLQEQFDVPTPVQAVGWSAALKGHDTVGIGQAGSGKTLGYLVPALLHISHHMKALKRQHKDQPGMPLGLVLAPTRELVDQVVKVAEQYGPSISVRSASVIGGSSQDCQVDYMHRHNPQLAVSTPSRLLELIQNGSLSLDHCGFVVLDEADRMMDSTLEPQIRAVLAHTRPGRQTMLWSATWPESVHQLATALLTDPLYFTVGSTTMLPSTTITQHVHVTELHDRRDLLRQLLQEHFDQNPSGKAIVFAATKDDVVKLQTSLRRCSAKFSAESFHGNMLQRHRKMLLDGFRRGYFSVLVATDLASRGLDIPDLSCVVNFDYPKNIETYIHRVGRTGRQGQPGVAHTFFCQRDTPKAKKLVEVLKMSGQHVDGKLRYMALKEDLPASMTETYIPFVPLKDRFGNSLIQTESPLASGIKAGQVRGSAKEQAFMLKNEAKREALVQNLKGKKIHATRHCVERSFTPRASLVRKQLKSKI